jgi:hypothetical protein
MHLIRCVPILKLLQTRSIKVICNIKVILNKGSEYFEEFQLIRGTENRKMHLIRFLSILNPFEMKLMNVIWNLNARKILTFASAE